MTRFKGDVYEWVGVGVMRLLEFLSRRLGWYSVRDRNLPFAIGSSLGHIWWILGLFPSYSRQRLSGTRHKNEGRRREGKEICNDERVWVGEEGKVKGQGSEEEMEQ